MHRLKWFLPSLVVVILGVALLVWHRERAAAQRLAPFQSLMLPADQGDAGQKNEGPSRPNGKTGGVAATGKGVRSKPGLRVMFMGVTTLLISDGQTNILTDGYYTRPSLTRFLLGKIEPNEKIIAQSLERAGIQSLDAILVVHSHFDHAMDAPAVARRTGGVVMGSESTANICRGLKLPEQQIRVVQNREPIRVGKFRITFIENKHYPLPGWIGRRLAGKITKPLIPPTSAFDYKQGEAYSILIEHPQGRLLVHGSAGFLPGALKGVRAGTILLGTAGAGDYPAETFAAYIRETVEAVGAKRILPIHWDSIFAPASAPPKPEKDFPQAMHRLQEYVRSHPGTRLNLLPAWKRVTLQPIAAR